jgi:HEAT repeat protein
LIGELISGDDQRAERVVPRLAIFGDAALGKLLPLLTSDNPDHRWWAVRALAEFEQPSARDGLCKALSDHSYPAVRHCAAMGLREQPTTRALPALLTALQEKDRLLSRLAADALAALGPKAIPELQEASQSEDAAVRIEAVRALAMMKDPETIGTLFSLLDDPSSVVTYWAEKGLEDLGVGMVFFEP